MIADATPVVGAPVHMVNIPSTASQTLTAMKKLAAKTQTLTRPPHDGPAATFALPGATASSSPSSPSGW